MSVRSKWARTAVPLLALAASLYAVTATAAAPAATVTLRAIPNAIFKGERLQVSAFVAGYKGSCVLTVRYKGGRIDHRTGVVAGFAVSWTFRVPGVPTGPATMRANCGSTSSEVLTTSVQLPLQTPKLEVLRRGFTQVPLVGVIGSEASYGLAIHNDRATSDAVAVDVLVNFISADDRVLGSDHLLIQRLPAGMTFYGGGLAFLSGTTAVVRIETVVHAISAQPQGPGKLLVSDLVVNPRAARPSAQPAVDSVHGQILNTYKLPMQVAQIGVVVLDSAGNIIGGGTSHAAGPLTLGAREAFSVSGTFRPVPFASVASEIASAIPTYPAAP